MLPTLWLAIGFQHGASIIVYAPPNPIELREYLKVKDLCEKHLGRTIEIRIFFNGENILPIYQKNFNEYVELCKSFAKSAPPFTDVFHVEEFKRHFQPIAGRFNRSFVFPFQTMNIHRDALSAFQNIVLPDVPTVDKAKHNFILRQHQFTHLPDLIVSWIRFQIEIKLVVSIFNRRFLPMALSPVISKLMTKRFINFLLIRCK